MATPIRFLSWILGVVFTLGLADTFAHLTYKMGKGKQSKESFKLEVIIEGWDHQPSKNALRFIDR